MLNIRAWTIVRVRRLLILPSLAAEFIAAAAELVLRPLSAVAVGDSGEVLVARVVAAVSSLLLQGLVWSLALWVTAVWADEALRGRSPIPSSAIAMLLARMPSARTVIIVWVLFYSVLASLDAVVPWLARAVDAIVLFMTVFAFPAYLIDGLPFTAALRFSLVFVGRNPRATARALATPVLVWSCAIICGWVFWYFNAAGQIFTLVAYAVAAATTVVHVVGFYRELRYSHAAPSVIALPEPADASDEA